MSDRIKAVVIDDVDLIRNLLAEVLMQRGYEVVSFAAPQEFSSCLRESCQCHQDERQVDLLLTDNQMTPVSGLEMIEQQLLNDCKLLAKNRAVISGSWTLEERAKAKRLGCQTFDKPCSLETIQSWLDSCEHNLLRPPATEPNRNHC